MVLKVLGYVGLVAFMGVCVQMMMTTMELSKIDKSLTTSLNATTELGTVEHAIIERNQALPNVISTTKTMDQTLNTTLAITRSIRSNIVNIDNLNHTTLTINQGMKGLSSQGTGSLQNVQQNISGLTAATRSLEDALMKLDQIIHTDRANLDQLKADTDTMNRKTPGVG